MVTDDAAGGDEVGETVLAGAEAKIAVLKTVPVGLVKTAAAQEPFAADEAAGGGDGRKFGVRSAGLGGGDGFAVMDGIAAVAEDDPGVINLAGSGVELEIADDTGVRIPSECGEQRFEPAGGEHEIVVEEREKFTLGDAGGAIVGGGVAEVAVVQEDDVGRREGGEKVPGCGAGAVVDEDDLVGETGGQGSRE